MEKGEKIPALASLTWDDKRAGQWVGIQSSTAKLNAEDAEDAEGRRGLLR